MGPWPFSENSSLPNDTITESLTSIPTQVLADTPSPSTLSGATTPSPTPQEVIPIVEHHVDIIEVLDDDPFEATPCYPTPGDIMPYDHSLPNFIRQVNNEPNLANLQSLSLRVISTCISLHRMASYLPNLRELDLEGSILSSLRDIGCNFKNLQILKVGHCQLESLDGTFGLSTLRELYAQKNLINDVSPCSNLPHIKHIDVSGNRIRNISYAGFLSVCNKLKSIVFSDNPAAEVPDYRKHVRRILPQIESLDGIPFSCDEVKEEIKEPEIMNNIGHESDSSTDIPDFLSVSPTDSMNNMLDSEEETNFLDKKYEPAKIVGSQDKFDLNVQEVLSKNLSEKCDTAHKLKITHIKNNTRKETEKALEQPKVNEEEDNKIINIEQKLESPQKSDRDIENRSKKSNAPLRKNYKEEILTFSSKAKGLKSDDLSLKTSNTTKFNKKSQMSTLKTEVKKPSEWDVKIQQEKSSTSSISQNENMNLENATSEISSGAFKKKFSTNNNTMLETPNKTEITLGVSSLTSGSPIRGNLAAALRSRNKVQSGKEKIKLDLENFKAKTMDKIDNEGYYSSENEYSNDEVYPPIAENDSNYLKEIFVDSEKFLE